MCQFRCLFMLDDVAEICPTMCELIRRCDYEISYFTTMWEIEVL